MQVIFKKAQKLGGRTYGAGPQELPDSLAYNLAFKQLVKSGEIQLIPRDAQRQRIHLSRDADALQRAQNMRKAHQPAPSAPSAIPSLSEALEPVQALPTPAQPALAGAAVQALKPAAPATAPKRRSKKGAP